VSDKTPETPFDERFYKQRDHVVHIENAVKYALACRKVGDYESFDIIISALLGAAKFCDGLGAADDGEREDILVELTEWAARHDL
jgi:hypothetical protein